MKTQALMDDADDLFARYSAKNAEDRMSPAGQAMLNEIQTGALLVIARQLQVANMLEVTTREGRSVYVLMDSAFWRQILGEIGLSQND
jgi:hypothetical protein